MQKLGAQELKEKARQLRILVVKMLSEAGSGHAGGSMGMADVFACLYFGGVMQYDPKNPGWNDRDRFILSNGHICPIRYAAMAEAGFSAAWATASATKGRRGRLLLLQPTTSWLT